MAKLPLGEGHGWFVFVECPSVKQIRDEHFVAVLTKAFGRIQDPLADTEHRVKKHNVCHASTKPSGTDSCRCSWPQ